MITAVALVLIAIYIAIGVECCYRGPVARKRVKAGVVWEAVLFCAGCKSNKRRYEMTYIACPLKYLQGRNP